MKTIKYTAFILVFLFIGSCATLTRHLDLVERDEFLNKFSLVNNEILGELKYDNQYLDLRTLGLDNYPDLFAKVDLTEDYKRVVEFVQNNTSELKFVVHQNTFIICIRSDDYDLSLCDDASTPDPTPDRVDIGKHRQTIDELYGDLVSDLPQN
ncbi:MAG: hypothetical protein MUO43_06630 [Desulfobacterales bacterium]|nr:hypothetical protein [Desulfobacterales bacterium]